PKAAAEPVRKVIESAVANAVHNAKLTRESLYVQTITADGGPTLKRWRPRAFGRAAPIRKRTTHIMVVVSDVEPVKKEKKK
ncbi:MAG: 50S ribosomal protein L22, partial [bacterium]|nr:50S ribosomal protein L22 [bacterium]